MKKTLFALLIAVLFCSALYSNNVNDKAEDIYYEALVMVVLDEPEGLKMMEQSANMGYADAQAYLGRHYYDAQDYKQSYKWYEKAAYNGNEEGIQHLLELHAMLYPDKTLKPNPATIEGKHVKINYDANKWTAQDAILSPDITKNDVSITDLYLFSYRSYYEFVMAYYYSSSQDAFTFLQEQIISRKHPVFGNAELQTLNYPTYWGRKCLCMEFMRPVNGKNTKGKAIVEKMNDGIILIVALSAKEESSELEKLINSIQFK